jgi:FixJ family two-component response regulator
MKERIYCQYYRCIVYEKRLLLIQENNAAYEKLKLRLEKAKQRLEKMRKRITLIRTEATNKQVAEVIGIKKGTVDASLHKLKARLNNLSEKSQLN